jgi:hypothetical protein
LEKVECEFCHTVFDAAPKEYGANGRGVIQVLVCPDCGLVKPLARITNDGVMMRELMSLLRSEGLPVPEELVQNYEAEFTQIWNPKQLALKFHSNSS